MNAVFRFLAEQPLIVLFILFAAGTAIGAIRIGGVRIGPAAVLFLAITITATGAALGSELSIPAVVGNLGLVLFTYTVGVLAGPSFFGAVRNGYRAIGGLAVLLGLVGLVAVLLGRALGLSGPTIAGTFAGALTNTPALAAAGERAGDAAAPTVGYSISYIFGVVGMLVAASVALSRRGGRPTYTSPGDDAPAPLISLTVRVDRSDRPLIAQIKDDYGVTVSRLQRGGEGSSQLVATEEDTLGRDDLVTVVGPADVVSTVTRYLGHASSHDQVADRHSLDFRRITLSSRALAGRTIGQLNLQSRFGAVVSRVRRGDLDMVATDETVVLLGDRLRVVAPAARMKEISAHLGDSVHGLSDINPLGLALGMSLGLLIGAVTVPLPGGGFTIGAAAGTLLVGLVFGRIGRIGPMLTTVPYAAASAMSQFGMLAFLAWAGTRAGSLILPALRSGEAWRIAVLGVAVTTTLAAGILLVSKTKAFRTSGVRLSGVVAGAQTQPAILAYANERTGFDPRVALGYAMVYPVAMIAKILLAQLIAGVS